MVVYLNDIIVFGSIYSEMLSNLESVFERLQKAGLTLRFAKCKFAQSSLHILGHVVCSEGIK